MDKLISTTMPSLYTLCFIVISLFMVSVTRADTAADCDTALTTREINNCAYEALLAAQTVMERYFEASLTRYEDDKTTADSIRQSQVDWHAYAESHCSAVYDSWRDGTISTLMTIECQLLLTNLRTYILWESFLTHMDSTPPVLPKPEY